LELNFENALNGLKKDVLVLHNEAGGYMAILRAKANVEFQAREAEEKAAAAAAAAAAISGNPEQKEHDHAEEEGEEENDYEYDEYDGEEKETNTITRTRTVTVTLDDTVSSADAAVDVVPEAAAPAEVAEPIAEDTPEVEDSIPIEEKEEEEETSVADPEPAPLPTTSEFAINTVSGDSDEVKVHLEPIV
jgi:ribosomal protein L12E/L44/L45/RPP1/RPP2